jgi:putative glutamine amidotransferase
VNRRPLIGISTSEERPTARSDPAPEGEPPRREMVLGMSYVRAIDAAGGLPIVLPPVHHAGADELLDDLDGLCLPGGPDIHPTLYGAEPHPRLGPTWPQLDSFELALARRADRSGLPILAVCRGAQILNVARGGTLHQHLPDITDGSIEHRQRDSGSHPTHAARIEHGSRIGEILGVNDTRVNSFHHQGMDELGEGLHAVAWSPDGVVEAIEAQTGRYVVGVQWHAEGLADAGGAHARLFPSFVAAARDHATLGDRQTA